MSEFKIEVFNHSKIILKYNFFRKINHEHLTCGVVKVPKWGYFTIVLGKKTRPVNDQC